MCAWHDERAGANSARDSTDRHAHRSAGSQRSATTEDPQACRAPAGCCCAHRVHAKRWPGGGHAVGSQGRLASFMFCPTPTTNPATYANSCSRHDTTRNATSTNKVDKAKFSPSCAGIAGQSRYKRDMSTFPYQGDMRPEICEVRACIASTHSTVCKSQETCRFAKLPSPRPAVSRCMCAQGSPLLHDPSAELH